MMAKIHEVKLHAKYFDLVLEGKKRAEFRKNDRNYEHGDTLILHEWVQGVYTGRKVEARITDVTDLSDWLEDYVLLSIELLNTGAYEIVNWKELSERGLVSGIKTASVTASDSVTATVPVVTVKASTRVTLDTPEVVCTNKLTTGTLEVQKGGTMRGNIEHTGGELSSNGKVLHTHKHPGDSGGTTGGPL